MIDRDLLVNSLLRYNYFPTQKKDNTDLPPIINSLQLTEAICSQITASRHNRHRAYSGYDAVEYRLTRFNGTIRSCSIPHPRAHIDLTYTLARHWHRLQYIVTNQSSKIRPKIHDDGRILAMDYGTTVDELNAFVDATFSRRQLVKTDISNCFPSIYSHAIPWALVGPATAKENASKRSRWYNQIDQAIRWTKRNETNGVGIGPGTSTIVAEIILARIDAELSNTYNYSRYIDDYTAYCDSDVEAQSFVRDLSDKLNSYRMNLNVEKTKIEPMPLASRSNWVIDLRQALPRPGRITPHDAADYLDYTIRIAKGFPDGSVFKYGIKSLIGVVTSSESSAEYEVINLVLRYILSLSFHHAVLLPTLERLFDIMLAVDESFRFSSELQGLLREHVRFRRSDAISWVLYFFIKYSVPLDDLGSEIVESEDCIPMLLLYRLGNPKHQDLVIDFANQIDRADLYKLDRFWLVLYQLYRHGRIPNPYGTAKSGGGTFETLKSEGVSFID